MACKSNEKTYGAAARTLHWVLATLIILMVLSGWLNENFPPGVIIPVHKAMGILVLTLSAVRILWWLADRMRPGDDMLTWEKWPSRLVKWTLLAISFLSPLTGWLLTSAAGRGISFFGLFQVPLLMGPDKPVAQLFDGVHSFLGYVVTIAIVLHIGGALRHHLILKDDILWRMWPRGGGRSLPGGGA